MIGLIGTSPTCTVLEVDVGDADFIACTNGQFAPNAYPGIHIGSAVDDIQISLPAAGKCGYMDRVAHLANKQSYGLAIDNDAAQHLTVIGGQYDGNMTGTWTHRAEAHFISAATPP